MSGVAAPESPLAGISGHPTILAYEGGSVPSFLRPLPGSLPTLLQEAESPEPAFHDSNSWVPDHFPPFPAQVDGSWPWWGWGLQLSGDSSNYSRGCW